MPQPQCTRNKKSVAISRKMISFINCNSSSSLPLEHEACGHFRKRTHGIPHPCCCILFSCEMMSSRSTSSRSRPRRGPCGQIFTVFYVYPSCFLPSLLPLRHSSLPFHSFHSSLPSPANRKGGGRVSSEGGRGGVCVLRSFFSASSSAWFHAACIGLCFFC